MKISIVGVGNVGSSICYELICKSLCSQIVLIDIDANFVKGKALDLSQSATLMGEDVEIVPSSNYEDIKNSHIVIVTAGLPRKEGMSRDDLLLKNASITKDIASNIAKFASESIIIEVANPLDMMTYVALKYSGFSKDRVIGMAGVLDSARMSYLISQELNVKKSDVKSIILGTHGNEMIPIVSQCKVKDRSINELLSDEKIANIIQKTKQAGGEIVSYMNTSAYYAPASGVVKMVKEISNPTGEVLPCAVYLDGEYGYKDVVCGVGVTLGKSGVKNIQEFKLTQNEADQFSKAVKSFKNLINLLNENR